MKKREADVALAKERFDEEFSRTAFKEGWPKPPGRQSRDPRLREAAAEEHGRLLAHRYHESLALYCLAFEEALALRPPSPESRAIPDLIRQMRKGAREMAIAADALGKQLLEEAQECGRPIEDFESRRYTALYRLAYAFNSAWRDHVCEELYERVVTPHAEITASGARIRHGFESCTWLYGQADHLLRDFPEPDHPVAKTRGADVDPIRDAFIEDLATLYGQAVRPPSASLDFNGEPSPFIRFVNAVFDEVRQKAAARSPSLEIERPGLWIVDKVVKRSAKKSAGDAHR